MTEITDKMVCEAYKEYTETMVSMNYTNASILGFPYKILMERTGESERVCRQACGRAFKRGLIDFSSSLESWILTEKGLELLNS